MKILHTHEKEFVITDIRERRKCFRKVFRIMYPLDVPSPGSQKSIAPNRFSKFDREHAFLSRLRFWSIYSPMGTKMNFFTISIHLTVSKSFKPCGFLFGNDKSLQNDHNA